MGAVDRGYTKLYKMSAEHSRILKPRAEKVPVTLPIVRCPSTFKHERSSDEPSEHNEPKDQHFISSKPKNSISKHYWTMEEVTLDKNVGYKVRKLGETIWGNIRV